MGILKKAGQYLAAKATAAAEKVADGVAKTASLSPSQLQQIEKKRAAYFAEKPDADGKETQELIQKNLGAVSIEVYQAYLELLKKAYLPMRGNVSEFDPYNRIRYFDITKWVTDPTEKNLDKLINVYQVLSEEDCNIALLYNRTAESCQVTMAVVNTDPEISDPAKAKTFYERIIGAIRGNFPGVEIGNCGGTGEPVCLNNAIQGTGKNQSVKSVAIVSNLASEKSEDFISQSMEKLLDGIVPTDADDAYTVVLLAKPITDQLASKNRLFELYSALAPYASWQTNFTYTESDAKNSSATAGVNLGMNVGRHTGKNQSFNVGGSVGVPGIANLNAGYSRGWSTGNSIGGNFGVNFARASSVTVQVGKNEGITQTYTNYGVKHTLDVIEKQIERLDESSALGMWEFAAYIIAKSPVTANNVAHMYLALTQGEKSHMTRAAVNLWDGEEEKEQAAVIIENIQKLQHPVFGLKDSIDVDMLMYPTLVTPSAELSGKELAKALNFPQKSVSGLPVLETTPFGREVKKYTSAVKRKPSPQIEIGSVYHMRQKEANTVRLDVNDLSSHTFVTGSTGTGKSNTIYQLLSKLKENGVHYLVVEPAKGEYKKVFGGSCAVYGTNGMIAPLLQVNPFSFPSGIHVLEHIDRLIEIFNACWPMYAAMPAILKDAVEKCYEKVGWNLRFSKCDPLRFPTFKDLIETLPEVMDSSLYSADTKSDYAGALITRVRSLTNGINGQIFCSDAELSNTDLFEHDVIVDLSRVGGSETKSLLMGILVMKLQEYRMELDAMNEDLVHVTVLEEAHNLLRRTSTSQSQEGANLQGKAVEMITNSIAEMRTYGEGFIIADQAPELLDEAVIRNTNTKIVLRLPNKSDRDLVGTSMALNDEQIMELAKLPFGVAAVYQNDWIEAVLCLFDEYTDKSPYNYTPSDNSKAFDKYFSFVFGVKEKLDLSDEDIDSIRNWIGSVNESAAVIKSLRDALYGVPVPTKAKEVIAYNVFEGKKIAAILAAEQDVEIGIERANRKIMSSMALNTQTLIDEIRKCILTVIINVSKDGVIQRRYGDVEARRQIL